MNKGSYFRYDNHVEHWDEVLSDPDKKAHSETWFDKGTLDAWRHQRMHTPLDVIVEHDNESSWLTVGDGRYGTDGNYLLEVGAKNVHCTDISDVMLRIGNEKGFIKDYSAQNAEELHFSDNSFDWVYCKESFHHFPRPYIALYEMFRVARKGVILTEPRDQDIDKAPLSPVLKVLKVVLGRGKKVQHSFEKVGNYVYSLSEREIEKFMLGMHYIDVAYYDLNDSYFKGVEKIKLDSVDKHDRRKKNYLIRKIFILNMLVMFGLKKSSLLTAVVFKEEPDEVLKDKMAKHGWRTKSLPKNPNL